MRPTVRRSRTTTSRRRRGSGRRRGRCSSAWRRRPRQTPHGPPRLLEIGCWVGFLLAEAQAQGLAAEGIEPSDFAAAYAREQHGLVVQHASLAEAELDEGAFAAIVMADVIEHLIDPGRRCAAAASCSRRAAGWRSCCPTPARPWRD